MTTITNLDYRDKNNNNKKIRKGKLVKVAVSNNTFSHDFDDINCAVSPHDEIQFLEIKNSKFHFSSLKFLQNCQQLTHLTITTTNLKDFGYENVKNCQLLKYIDLSNNLIEEPNESLLELQFLEFLSYGNNKINRISLKFIENVEQSNLKTLNFIFNRIINALYMTSAQEIAKLLKNHYYLNFEKIFTPFHLEKSFNLLKATNFVSDFKIITADKIFDVHKCILNESSKILHNMIKIQEVENLKPELKIDDFETQIVEEFLNFIYDGKIRKNSENLIELYRIAKNFGVSDLRKFCEYFIIENFCEKF
ncbi:hypothetical protein PVAND_015991 [Polypedilum vanderplanki]|uniref:BTB domain-containing protein n=1 Tax=Polypedilum vanderplanki TaxID=319348 RepID=A0A9J6BEA8_POLVA|nr:hypothetical protein PVAND_015991 [Polypedilum vanderplanki]